MGVEMRRMRVFAWPTERKTFSGPDEATLKPDPPNTRKVVYQGASNDRSGCGNPGSALCGHL
jgi:hypothetical protein